MLCYVFVKKSYQNCFSKPVSMVYWESSEVGSQGHPWKCVGAFAATSKHKRLADSAEAGGLEMKLPANKA